jgi:predicted dinucleotide-binding enzyme
MRPPPPSCSPPIFPPEQGWKAFNTMHYATLASGGDTAKPSDDRLAIFVAGDNGQANSIVSELIEGLGFAASIPAGSPKAAAASSPAAPSTPPT